MEEYTPIESSRLALDRLMPAHRLNGREVCWAGESAFAGWENQRPKSACDCESLVSKQRTESPDGSKLGGDALVSHRLDGRGEVGRRLGIGGP